ncbi:MAG: molecular chaperone HtpG [Saprospiraceae bacterium]|nr:molecular chaperone HtpG [Saprospiraceae bacterium]
MEKGSISVQSQNIFPIIKKFLYADHDIFLRELISNAVDASQKLKTLVNKGVVKSEIGDLTIEVLLDEEAKTLTIRDRGIGMTEDEVKKYLNQVAFSSAEEFVKKYKAENTIIGHFGLGFYSAFMVSDKVEVITKSYQKNAKATRWECDGEPEYFIESSDKKERGTDVILHINEESKEFLDKNRIESLLKKYCRFLPIPIQFGTKTETTYEGEGEDAKEIATEVANIINNTDPAWKKSPSSLTDEDYKNFYNELYPFSQPPLFWIHLNIDFPFNLTGILYFPKLSQQLEVQKNKIQLYSNQVYVTDDVKDIVPEFLTLMHGVIDSPDIPLNVSRSYLQSDHNVKKITGYITKKVAEKLQSLFKKDRELYASKWEEIAPIVKYGMLTEDKFYDKAKNFALLKNTEGENFTIEEYQDKVKSNQTDKHGKIVFLYANQQTDQNTFIAAAKNRGYDVLLLDQIIDNHFIQHLEHKNDKILFVRVDSDTADNLIQTDETVESVLSDKDQEKVKTLFETVLKKDGHSIQLKALTKDDHPVMITRPEFMRRMQEMQRLQGMGMGGADMPDFHQLVINSNHPLIADKLLKMKSEQKKEDFVKYLYDLARLNQQMLKGADLSSFINRSLEFVS